MTLAAEEPFALAVVGTAGSGKSTVALEIAKQTGAAYVDKDRLAPLVDAALDAGGHSVEERESSTFYRDQVMPKEYAALLAVASDNLRLGLPVVIDAPFAAYLNVPEYFRRATDAAGWPRVRKFVLRVSATESETHRRLLSRGLPRDRAKLSDWNEFWTRWGRTVVSWKDVELIEYGSDSGGTIDDVIARLVPSSGGSYEARA